MKNLAFRGIVLVLIKIRVKSPALGHVLELGENGSSPAGIDGLSIYRNPSSLLRAIRFDTGQD